MTAFYDPIRDKIYGCRKNSFIWWHEKGHQNSFRKGIEQQIQGYSWLLIIVSILSIAIQTHAFLAIILMSLVTIGVLYSELYAWFYAFSNFKFGGYFS